MAGRLAGRWALVTGSTSGIGRAIALAYAAEGAHVIVTGRRAELGAKVVADATGGSAVFIAGDLSDGAGVRALAEAALAEAGGRIDLIFLTGPGTPAAARVPGVSRERHQPVSPAPRVIV